MVLYRGKSFWSFQPRRNEGLCNNYLHGLSPDVTKIDFWSKICATRERRGGG